MAIQVNTRVTDRNLMERSHWWGAPDLPEGMAYPCIEVEDKDGGTYFEPLTFVCQIRCSDIAKLDPKGLLPHRGLLYFFAPIDYFLVKPGDLKARRWYRIEGDLFFY